MARTGRPRIVVIGACPPPYMGPTLATNVILNSRLNDEFELIHLDTSDHRPLDTLGAVDFSNIYLALKSYIVLFWLLVTKWPSVVYIPISQTTLGYLRDSGYITLGRLLGRRVVCHLRGGHFKQWLDNASFATRWYVRVIHRLVHAQIVLGHCLKPLFENVLNPERVFVVPNGKDILFPTVAKHRSDSRRRVLYLGNMIRSKGIMDVLHSIPEVASRVENVEYVLVGAWTEADTRKEVESFLAANPQLPIRLIGEAKGNEKLYLLAGADVFVFPSYYPPEGHPWVIIEAMAAGLPIISTDQGAIRESVLDGENGFIVPKQTPCEIARKTVLLLKDAHLQQSMGKASLRRYRQHFTEEVMISNLGQVLRHVVYDRDSPESRRRKLLKGPRTQPARQRATM